MNRNSIHWKISSLTVLSLIEGKNLSGDGGGFLMERGRWLDGEENWVRGTGELM
jgi:hypothetical protein